MAASEIEVGKVYEGGVDRQLRIVEKIYRIEEGTEPLVRFKRYFLGGSTGRERVVQKASFARWATAVFDPATGKFSRLKKPGRGWTRGE